MSELEVPETIGEATSPSAEHIDAVLHYAGRTVDTPFVDVTAPERSSNLVVDPRSVTITNARMRRDELSLDAEGLVLIDHETAVKDFHDSSKIPLYLTELESLVQGLVSADRVVASPQVAVRSSDRAAIAAGAVAPGSLVHSDYTAAGLRSLVLPEVGIDIESDEFKKYKRLQIFQTWRAFSKPPLRNNLALCDRRSMSLSDSVKVDYIVSKPDPESGGYRREAAENYLYEFNPGHRWLYFSDLHVDELIVWLGYDGPSEAGRVMHCAFRDPSVSSSVHPRESIDARVLAFFEY